MSTSSDEDTISDYTSEDEDTSAYDDSHGGIILSIQCARCFKWRIIPDQEKYEEIRKNIKDQPFFCEKSLQRDREISCDNPTDLKEDGTRIWFMDKPSFPQPPPGWNRLFRLRNKGGYKFADVYYTSPTGTELHSIPEVSSYLQMHPDHAQGVTTTHFSFLRLRCRHDRKGPKPVQPIAWAAPEDAEWNI